jgi:hypothetical protein
LFFSFCSMPCLLLVSFSFWIQSQISVLHSTVSHDAPLYVADCIAPFPHSSKASSSVQDLCTLSWLVQHCLGQCSNLASYIPQAAFMVPDSSPKATTQELLVRLTIIHSAGCIAPVATCLLCPFCICMFD